MKGHQLAAVVIPQNTALVALQTRSITFQIAARTNEVAVKPDDAGIGVRLGPIHDAAGVERLIFEHLLTLENHRYAGCRERHGGAEGGKFSRPVAVGEDRVKSRPHPGAAFKLT